MSDTKLTPAQKRAHECEGLTRNLSTPESRDYWEFVDSVADRVKQRPKWQGGERDDEQEGEDA